MLCLTRELNEAVRLDVPGYGPIYIHVTEINYNRVKLGIDAPKEVLIERVDQALKDCRRKKT
jgi:carbon storage regulator CsrA